MPSAILDIMWVNINGTKPSPDPMLTYYEYKPQNLISKAFSVVEKLV